MLIAWSFLCSDGGGAFDGTKGKIKTACRRYPGSMPCNEGKGYPILAKILAGPAVVYALSPIDLIPDFIPVIGYLDDLIFTAPSGGADIKANPR